MQGNKTLLDDPVVAAYLLLMNLDDHGSGGSPTLAESTYFPELDVVGVAVALLKLSWVAPQENRPYRHQLLLQAWNDLAPGAGDIAALARAYLFTVLKIWASYEGDPSDWRDLASAVITGFDAEREHAGWRANWFIRVGLLASPEWGLPAQEANAWLGALKDCASKKGLWQVYRAALQVARSFINAQCIIPEPRSTNGESAKALIEEIDTRADGHEWKTLIEDRLQ